MDSGLVLDGPRLSEAPPQPPMPEEEVGRHCGRGQEVSDEDCPPDQRAHDGLGEDHGEPEEKDLKGREQYKEADEQDELTFSGDDHERGNDPKDDEAQAVEHGVAEDCGQVGRDRPGVRCAPEDHGAEQRLEGSGPDHIGSASGRSRRGNSGGALEPRRSQRAASPFPLAAGPSE